MLGEGEGEILRLERHPLSEDIGERERRIAQGTEKKGTGRFYPSTSRGRRVMYAQKRLSTAKKEGGKKLFNTKRRGRKGGSAFKTNGEQANPLSWKKGGSRLQKRGGEFPISTKSRGNFNRQRKTRREDKIDHRKGNHLPSPGKKRKLTGKKREGGGGGQCSNGRGGAQLEGEGPRAAKKGGKRGASQNIFICRGKEVWGREDGSEFRLLQDAKSSIPWERGKVLEEGKETMSVRVFWRGKGGQAEGIGVEKSADSPDLPLKKGAQKGPP